MADNKSLREQYDELGIVYETLKKENQELRAELTQVKKEGKFPAPRVESGKPQIFRA